MSEKAILARKLLYGQSVGVLSTHSVDVEGYPFGSIAPYALDYDSTPVVYVSDLAQHTRNVEKDDRVSLTVFDRYAEDPQAGARLTWIGEAEPLGAGEEAVRRRYARFFPSAASYARTHDFAFYRIRLRRARFIGGFGKIFWVEPDEMLLRNPFGESEESILDHMNADHRKALAHYCRLRDVVAAPEAVTMVGIDSEGFDMLTDGARIRFDFDAPVETPEQARLALVKLARTEIAAPAEG